MQHHYFSWKGMTIIAVIVLGVGGYFIFSASGKNMMNSGVAIITRSWSDAFGQGFSENNADSIDLMDENISSSTDGAPVASSVPDNDVVSAPLLKIAVSPTPKNKKSVPLPQVKVSDPPVASVSLIEPIVITPSSSMIFSSTTISTASACSFPSGATSSRKIIFNEIAWMGSLAGNGTSSSDAKAEWIEMKNISSSTITLAGWQVIDAAGKIKIVFDADDALSAGGLFLLARASSSAGKNYSGDLVNTGGTLAILDPQCAVSDFLNASGGWPAGNNSTKQTMERDADGEGWHASVLPGGTPGQENSVPLVSVAPVPVPAPSPSPAPIPVPAPAPSPVPPAVSNYSVTISIVGAGKGTVISNPPGLDCGVICSVSFSASSSLHLSAVPDNASVFGGWSGTCSGLDPNCALIIEGPMAITALFNNVSQTVTTTAPRASAPLIVAIQIAGASSTNDFVRIYNTSGSPFDMSGWKLRKKAASGVDSSVREFPDASVIAPHGYFVWANSAGGFSALVNADASSTATLSADNSLALMDASGTVIDAVAWGTGTDQYGEGNAFANDPTAGQVLQRKSANGIFIDSGDNASDFAVQ